MMRSHQAAPSHFRHSVDMTLFTSLTTHFSVLKEMPQADITTLTGRVAEFIGWVMHTKQVSQTEAVDVILVGQPLIVVQYITLLKDKPYSLKNGTIYNFLLDFTRWAKYLAVYENKTVCQFITIAIEQQKHECKKKKVDQQQRLTLENLIQHRHWPAKGKVVLSQILSSHKPKVDRILHQCAQGNVMTDDSLGFVNDWVISSLFVNNPQGRSQAIGKFPLIRLDELQTSTASSDQFKTRATYGSQSINCNASTFHYLQAYAKYVRPHLLLTKQPCSALFVNSNGKAHNNIGYCVTRFFNNVSTYHVTITNLRAMFETEVHDAMDAGVLTPNECDDVIRNSGHSSTTAQTHYLKRKAEAAGRNAMATHDKLYAQTLDTPSFIGRPLDDWYNVDEDKDDDEPTAPPTRMKARRCRIDWTGAELHQLATWVYDYEASHGIDATKNWGDCLTAMQATGVFDANHLTKIKLREAWRREVTKHKHK